MRKLSIIFFTAVVLTGSKTNGQAYQPSYENLTPVSPQAFQFAKYTEMPVSEYTGIPNISIPLYDISVDGLSIPITLTYHAAGIRVNQEASWVGLGWDLSFGSVVQNIYDGDDYGLDPITGNPYTRLLPDYHNSPVPTELPRRYDYPWMTNGPLWSNPYPVYPPQAANSFKICTDLYAPVNGDFATQQTGLFTYRWMDSEPDVFRANFLGHSLSFVRMLNPDRVVVVNKKGYAVFRINDTWKIITPTGDEFYFEQKNPVTTQNIIVDLNGSYPSAWDPSSNIWMLTKIITKNKQEVVFNYTTTAIIDNYPNYSERWEKATLNSQGAYNSVTDIGPYIAFVSAPHPPASNSIKTYSRSKQSYSYLTSIVFPKGQVVFNTSSRADMAGDVKLDNVQIMANQVVKSYQLNYAYFASVTGNVFYDPVPPNGNYSSQRLKLVSIQDNSGGSHTFTYNATLLPWKNSVAQDYWGFYNGQTSNTSLIPNPYQFNLFGLGNNGDNHSANLQYAKAAILEKIKYPTGGDVSFEYELHEFDNYWVPDFNSSANTISKGHGLRIKSVTHYASDNVQSIKKRYTYTGGKAILPRNIFRQFNLNKGVIYGPYNNLLDVFYYVINAASGSGFYSASLFGSVNGVGYDKVVKEEIDLAGVPKGRTETNFNNHPDIFIHSAVASCQVNATLPAIKDYNYYENGSIQSVFTYDNQNNLLKKIEHGYSNIIYSIYYGARVFPYTDLAYVMVNCYGGPCPYIYKQQNLIGYYPIFDYETLQQNAVVTEYSNGNTLGLTVAYGYDDYNRLQATEKTTSEGGTESEQYTYPEYNPSGLPIINTMWERNRLLDVLYYQKSKWLGFNGGVTSKYFKTYKEVGNKIMEDVVSIIDRLHPFDNRPTQISYDQYDVTNGNLLQYTTMGTTNCYIWDYNNEYIIAHVTNAPVSQVAHTSFEANGQGNWTFSGTPAPDNTAPTGKKAYWLGSGAISKTGLNNSAYYVSYWSKNGPQNVTATSSVRTGRSLGEWTNYEHKVLNPGGTITVSGNGTIDELRLFPDKAVMTTTTYEPLIGMLSQCDFNNRINYYEYDASNRLMLVRDQDKNIIKKICYNYYNQAENCYMATSYSNVYMSQAFTRNDCPPGYTGSQVTYAVQAGIYTSFVSQADANAQAQADINANGQAYANANGTCTPGGGGCNPSNCQGDDKKCINGVCETGIKVYTSSVYDPEKEVWLCTYHYEWSDASYSQDYEEKSETDCIPVPRAYSSIMRKKAKIITNNLK